MNPKPKSVSIHSSLELFLLIISIAGSNPNKNSRGVKELNVYGKILMKPV